MRQLVLAVLLIAAAFLGGAMVNGPGVRWVQARLLDYMGLKDGGEIASIDPPKFPDDGPGPKPSGGNQPATAPSRPVADEPRPAPSATDKPSEPAGGLGKMIGGLASAVTQATQRTGNAAAAKQPPPEKPAPLPIPSAAPEPAPPPRTAATEPARPQAAAAARGSTPPPGDPGPAPAPLDPEIGVALLASRSPADATPSASAGAKEHAGSAPLTLELAPSPAPGGPTAPATGAPSGGGEDWGGIRRKLQALGVRRYTIDGEPGGRVRFSCLVPLAGRQAVSQHFEAEGDDEAQAARAVIRRITLWRAARPAPSPAP